MDFEVVTSEGVDRIHVAVERDNLWAVVNTAIYFLVS
jgi:hypothetical protein